MTLNPSRISWLNTLIVGGTICVLGLVATGYTLNYLDFQLTESSSTLASESSGQVENGHDRNALQCLIDQTRLHLNSVIILLFGSMTVWGFVAVRRIGGLYENLMHNELNKCERELHDAYQQNLHKSRLATIGQTASVLAHEMHNPMSSIKLALSGLAGSDKLSARENKKIDLVLGEVNRLENLLSETLDYVRPVKVSDKPVDLEPLLKQIIKQQEPVIRQRQLSIDTREVQGPAQVCIDESQFHQVLLNLIKNAIEASPAGNTIQLSLKQVNGQLLFEISNGGKAMDQQTLKRAFEPFYTTKPKGTGLGLGLVKRVVDEHGGQVSIQSSPDRGTRVSIRFDLD